MKSKKYVTYVKKNCLDENDENENAENVNDENDNENDEMKKMRKIKNLKSTEKLKIIAITPGNLEELLIAIAI